METIGERIRNLRRTECHMTQLQFAERLGVTNAHISKIEKGLTIPSEALIKLICKSFNVSEYWLKDGITPMYQEQIEDESDKNLTQATKENNKLLFDENPLIRLTASKLQIIFANITNSDYISQENRLAYLGTILHLFSYINEIIETFKQDSRKEHFKFKECDINELLQFNLCNMELEIRKIVSFLIDDSNS